MKQHSHLANVGILKSLSRFEEVALPVSNRTCTKSLPRCSVYTVSRYICGSRCAPSRCLHEWSQRPSSPPNSEHLGCSEPSLFLSLSLFLRAFWFDNSLLVDQEDGECTSSSRQRVGDQPSRIRFASSRLDTEADTLHGHHNNADHCHDYPSCPDDR